MWFQTQPGGQETGRPRLLAPTLLRLEGTQLALENLELTACICNFKFDQVSGSLGLLSPTL